MVPNSAHRKHAHTHSQSRPRFPPRMNLREHHFIRLVMFLLPYVRTGLDVIRVQKVLVRTAVVFERMGGDFSVRLTAVTASSVIERVT